MKLTNFYKELEENIMLADFVKDAYEVEHCIDRTIELNTEITNYKLCLKNGGVEKVLKKVGKSVTANEIKDLIRNKERDLFANLKYMESETKIDRVRILTWLNEKYLETFNTYDETTIILNLAKQITVYLEQKRNLSSI